MMKMKKICALALAVLMLFALCACGSSSPKAAREQGAYTSAAPASAPSALWSGAASDSDSSYADYAEYEAMEEPMMAEEAGGFAADDNALTVSAKPSAGDIAVDKIIYSASATVETTAFDDTLTALEALIEQYGGFVESSSVSGNNYSSISQGYASRRSADYRIRIPSQSFSTVMSALPTLGNVPYSNTYTENITSQYYDTAARLEAYRAQEQSLLEMMRKAETVTDLLEIQEQLTDVRYRIESLQSTLTNWDRQVSYSTISLSVQEVREYTPEAKLSFGQQLALALSRGLKSIGEFFSDLLLWLIEALPALIILAVVVFLVVLLIRRIRRSREAKRAAAAAAAAPQTPPQT